MARFVSICCSCDYAFSITCPALKVPVAPTLVSPTNGCVLSSLSLAAAFTPIWAYGDTQIAINGRLSVNSDMTSPLVTCCLSRTCPCIQYDLSCYTVMCCPGVFYHDFRQVTASYEVSPYSTPACFCIRQQCYNYASGVVIYNTNATDVALTAANGTVGVANVVRIEMSCTCDFACVLHDCCYPITGSDCTVTFTELKCANSAIRPAGTYFIRPSTRAAYNAAVQCVGTINSYCIAGCSYIFALACDVPCSCCTFCDHLVLYGLYDCLGGNMATCLNKSISFKYEVSCDNTFATGVVTACGPFNVFIPRTCFACLACTHYVRQCVLCGANPFVQCSTWNNVVTANGLNFNLAYTSLACACIMCCGGVITTNNTIAVLGIGAGGPGDCHNGPSGYDLEYCCQHRCCTWNTSASGGSGYVCLATFSNKCGCCFTLLPGAYTPACCYAFQCCFCYCIGNAAYNCCMIGNTCFTITCGFPSKFELKTSDGATKVCTVCACGGSRVTGGSSGADGMSLTGRHKGAANCYCVRTAFGGHGGRYACWMSLCQSTWCLISSNDTCAPFSAALFVGYCCTNACSGSHCSGNCTMFCTPETCCCVNSSCGTPSLVGLNYYGYGGQGALLCPTGTGGACMSCLEAAHAGYGFGGGGSGSCQMAGVTNCFCNMCSCCSVFGYGGGGGGGMMFMCQYNPAQCGTSGCSSGRAGMIVFACQGF